MPIYSFELNSFAAIRHDIKKKKTYENDFLYAANKIMLGLSTVLPLPFLISLSSTIVREACTLLCGSGFLWADTFANSLLKVYLCIIFKKEFLFCHQYINVWILTLWNWCWFCEVYWTVNLFENQIYIWFELNYIVIDVHLRVKNWKTHLLEWI